MGFFGVVSSAAALVGFWSLPGEEGTRSLLLVGGLDQTGLWAWGWTGVFASALALVGLLTARLRPQALPVRVLQLVVLVPAGLVLALLTIGAGGFAWIFATGEFRSYVRLDVPDTRHGGGLVVNESHGASASTSWTLYQGGPFLYEHVTSELDQIDAYSDERVTPLADGAYEVRARDGELTLEFLGYLIPLP